MRLQTCRRHPSAGRFLVTCSGCTQELYDIEQANRARAEAERAAKVRAALGLRDAKVRPEMGETATRVSRWSVRELDDSFARVGGTVTAQQVQRTLPHGETYTVVEVTLVANVSGVGRVEAFTDWDPADETHGFALPVIRALAA
ncbi:hypothetical protein [Streptomyces mirabilis]|uniref:hypothetical protein n=1 Tax=Streptomyces mirabilis TaxID=68239 RepID=UPI0033E71A44